MKKLYFTVSPPQDSHLPSVVVKCLVVLDISALAR